MNPRSSLAKIAAFSVAGCAAQDAPQPLGITIDGHPVYSLSGGRLARLELVANGNCPMGSRPHLASAGGAVEDMSISYSCE